MNKFIYSEFDMTGFSLDNLVGFECEGLNINFYLKHPVAGCNIFTYKFLSHYDELASNVNGLCIFYEVKILKPNIVSKGFFYWILSQCNSMKESVLCLEEISEDFLCDLIKNGKKELISWER